MEKASVIFLAFLQRNGMVAVVILAVFAARAFAEMSQKIFLCIVGNCWNPYVI